MNSPVDISVVIITHNHEKWIHFCLDSLMGTQQSYDLEIILIDNASTDGTLTVVEKYPAVQIIRCLTNQGFCASNNLGIDLSKGEYILLINPDSMVDKNYLTSAIHTLQTHPEVALLAGKVLRMDVNAQPVLQGGLPLIDTAGIEMYSNRQAVDIGQGETDHGQYDQEGEVFGVSAAVCLCRRDALLEVAIDGQVFDNAFFAYKEDVDLSWRLRLGGWKCWYTPGAVAYHARGWQSGFKKRQQIPQYVRYHSFKNRRLMILKNETLRSFLPNALPILWFELRAFVYVLLREPFLLKAYWQVLKDLPRLLR